MNAKKYYVSREEKDFYYQNGYLIIKKLFEPESLEIFTQRFSEVCKDKELSKKYTVLKDITLKTPNSKPEDYINKVQDILHDPVFMRYSEDPTLLDVVSQFIGEELTALNCMLVNKPPGINRHPPHQDSYYFPIRPVKVIGTWTAIDRSFLDNGCLYCVPGSNKLGLLPHVPFENVKRFYHIIAEEDIYNPVHKRVQLEVDPGDTILIHPCLIHGSGPNMTKAHRKAMTIHYMNSEFVDISGSIQNNILKDFVEKVPMTGTPISYHEFWRLKSKKVHSSRSHL